MRVEYSYALLAAICNWRVNSLYGIFIGLANVSCWILLSSPLAIECQRLVKHLHACVQPDVEWIITPVTYRKREQLNGLFDRLINMDAPGTPKE